MEGRLKFFNKDKGIILIGGYPLPKVMVNTASASLTNIMDKHDQSGEQKIEGMNKQIVEEPQQ